MSPQHRCVCLQREHHCSAAAARASCLSPFSFFPLILALQISAAMPSITRLFSCEIAEAPSSIVFVGQSFVFVGDSQGCIHVLELANQSKTHEILPSAALRAAVVHMSSSRTARPCLLHVPAPP